MTIRAAALLQLCGSLGAAAQLPTVEIAAGVEMPVVSLGSGGSSESLNVTDYTRLWLEAGGRAIDCAAGYSDAYARAQPAVAGAAF